MGEHPLASGPLAGQRRAAEKPGKAALDDAITVGILLTCTTSSKPGTAASSLEQTAVTIREAENREQGRDGKLGLEEARASAVCTAHVNVVDSGALSPALHEPGLPRKTPAKTKGNHITSARRLAHQT